MIAGKSHLSTTSPLPRSVRRALDAMHANVGHNWSVTELATIAGVSGRTLQRQFLSFLGKAPRAVLRDISFERARVSLGVEREHARHRAKGEIVRTEIGTGLSLRVIDLGKPQVWLQCRGNSCGEMLRGRSIIT